MSVSGAGSNPLVQNAPLAVTPPAAGGVAQAGGPNVTHIDPNSNQPLNQANGVPDLKLAEPSVDDINRMADEFVSICNMNPEVGMTADITALMMLFAQYAQTMRDSKNAERHAMTDAKVAAIDLAAEKMRAAADARYESAVLTGTGQIVSGAVQVGFSAGGMKAIGSGSMAETTRSSAISGLGSGLSSMVTGGFTIGAGAATHDADLADIEKQQADKAAALADTGYAEANDVYQQMLEIIRDMRQKVGENEQGQTQTNLDIARHIA